MKIRLAYDPQGRRIHLKEEVKDLLGHERKEVVALANATTLTIFDPETPIDKVIKSLEIVLQDLRLRAELEQC
ncbi:MAG: hypothetical protein JRD89_00880 [Deltaproteobacteria bacterium]|nr:hypothetical protein [Deltaproteobacteria bacterium]